MGLPRRNNSTAHEIRLEPHLWPLAPGLPRRPRSAAYGLGPSVFTLRAKRTGTDRASVSHAAACRGAPPLPAMSLGTCRCGQREQNSEGSRLAFGGRRGAGPGPGGTWFVRDPGTGSRTGTAGQGELPTGAKCRWGMAVLMQGQGARRGSTGFREIKSWNCSAGEEPALRALPGPVPKETRSEGPTVLMQRDQQPAEFCAGAGCFPEVLFQGWRVTMWR